MFIKKWSTTPLLLVDSITISFLEYVIKKDDSSLEDNRFLFPWHDDSSINKAATIIIKVKLLISKNFFIFLLLTVKHFFYRWVFIYQFFFYLIIIWNPHMLFILLR